MFLSSILKCSVLSYVDMCNVIMSRVHYTTATCCATRHVSLALLVLSCFLQVEGDVELVALVRRGEKVISRLAIQSVFAFSSSC